MEQPGTGLERAISLIYDAALDFERWPQALRGIGEYLDTPFIYLIVDDKSSGREPFCLGSDVSGEDLRREYQSDIFTADPSASFARAQRKFRYCMASTLIDEPDLSAIATVRRSPGQGNVQTADIRAFEPLVEHLRRAILISRRLVETDLRATAANGIADGLSAGILMLDRTGQVVFANRKIREIVERGDALALDDGGVRALRPSDDRELQTTIGSALAVAEGFAVTGGGDLLLMRRDDDRPYAATVSPLGCGLPPFGATPPVVLVLITDPDAAPEFSAVDLRRRWGLTGREAEVALRVAAGATVREIASALALSPRTVEVHLRNVFAKTGTKRQADLVRLFMTMPVLR